jgi:hypothetical protein
LESSEFHGFQRNGKILAHFLAQNFADCAQMIPITPTNAAVNRRKRAEPTPDQHIKSAMLYQLSYRPAQIAF